MQDPRTTWAIRAKLLLAVSSYFGLLWLCQGRPLAVCFLCSFGTALAVSYAVLFPFAQAAYNGLKPKVIKRRKEVRYVKEALGLMSTSTTSTIVFVSLGFVLRTVWGVSPYVVGNLLLNWLLRTEPASHAAYAAGVWILSTVAYFYGLSRYAGVKDVVSYFVLQKVYKEQATAKAKKPSYC